MEAAAPVETLSPEELLPRLKSLFIRNSDSPFMDEAEIAELTDALNALEEHQLQRVLNQLEGELGPYGAGLMTNPLQFLAGAYPTNYHYTVDAAFYANLEKLARFIYDLETFTNTFWKTGVDTLFGYHVVNSLSAISKDLGTRAFNIIATYEKLNGSIDPKQEYLGNWYTQQKERRKD